MTDNPEQVKPSVPQPATGRSCLKQALLLILGGILGLSIGLAGTEPGLYLGQPPVLIIPLLAGIMGIFTRSMAAGGILGLVMGVTGGIGIASRIMGYNNHWSTYGFEVGLTGILSVVLAAISGLMADLYSRPKMPK